MKNTFNELIKDLNRSGYSVITRSMITNPKLFKAVIHKDFLIVSESDYLPSKLDALLSILPGEFKTLSSVLPKELKADD